jgi:hypothetical protein
MTKTPVTHCEADARPDLATLLAAARPQATSVIAARQQWGRPLLIDSYCSDTITSR